MQKLMMRKQKMYEGMREASFLPGAGLTLIIALILYVTYYLLREIPAFLIDMIYYSQQSVTSDVEAKRVIQEYVTAPGTMAVSLALTSLFLALTIFYVRKVEKRPLSTIGLAGDRALGRFSGGYAIGLALFALAALPGILNAAGIKGIEPAAALFVLGYIIQAVSEEAFFRGYMLSSLTAKTGAVPAALISSAMFALLQISNYGASGLMILAVFLSGVLYAFYTLRTGSIWGAAGIHAAWNFAYGLVSPVVMGELSTDYSVLKPGEGGELFPVLTVAVCIAFILLVVFAGENRLAVPISNERRMYLDAKKAANAALSDVRGSDGVPFKKYAYSLASALPNDETKAAALLYAIREGGRDFVAEGYGAGVLAAVNTLCSGVGIAKDPLAHEIKAAASKCRYAMRERYIKHARQEQGRVYCPLLRREIEEPRCADTMQTVDSGDREGLFGMMDLGICFKCSRRNE